MEMGWCFAHMQCISYIGCVFGFMFLDTVLLMSPDSVLEYGNGDMMGHLCHNHCSFWMHRQLISKVLLWQGSVPFVAISSVSGTGARRVLSAVGLTPI